MDGAAVYAALAEAERDPNLANIYRRLAAVERAHAEFWQMRLDRSTGRSDAADAEFSCPRSELARAPLWSGGWYCLPWLATEARGSSHYEAQPDAVAQGMPADERAHARIIQAASSTPKGMTGPALARLEGRHRGTGGNALRAAVLGANDGLVSNLSLVMGIAGANPGGRAVLLAGLRGARRGCIFHGHGRVVVGHKLTRAV